jgi:hypothetical protein
VDAWDYHKHLAMTCTTPSMRIRSRLTQSLQMEVSSNYGESSVPRHYLSMIQRRCTISSSRTNTFSTKLRGSLCNVPRFSNQDTHSSRMLFGYRAAGLVWGEGLFATSGEQHRKQGKMLSSVFSGARMRNMGEYFPFSQ